MVMGMLHIHLYLNKHKMVITACSISVELTMLQNEQLLDLKKNQLPHTHTISNLQFYLKWIAAITFHCVQC